MAKNPMIRLSKETQRELKDIKIVNNESYENVIKRVLSKLKKRGLD
jgi:uncharacterized protein (DUF302 family)